MACRCSIATRSRRPCAISERRSKDHRPLPDHGPLSPWAKKLVVDRARSHASVAVRQGDRGWLQASVAVFHVHGAWQQASVAATGMDGAWSGAPASMDNVAGALRDGLESRRWNRWMRFQLTFEE